MRPPNTKLSHVLLSTLLDQQWHSVSDLLPYFQARVDPSTACRTFLRDRDRSRNDARPIEWARKEYDINEQVRLGSYRVVSACLSRLCKDGLIEAARPDGERRFAAAAVRLTPLGWSELCRTERSCMAGAVWNEFRWAVSLGRIILKEVEVINREEGRQAPPAEGAVKEDSKSPGGTV